MTPAWPVQGLTAPAGWQTIARRPLLSVPHVFRDTHPDRPADETNPGTRPAWRGDHLRGEWKDVPGWIF